MECLNCKKKCKTMEQNKFFPFCSERCKMIDLGRWFNEDMSLPLDEKSETWSEKRGDSI